MQHSPPSYKYSSESDLTSQGTSDSRKRKQNPDMEEISSLRSDLKKMFEDLKADQDAKLTIIAVY